MPGLTIYSHVENTCMTASFHKEGRIVPIVVYQHVLSRILGGAKGGATGSDVTGSHVIGSGPDRK